MFGRDWVRQQGVLKASLKVGSVFVALGCVYIFFLWLTLPDIQDPRSLLASQSTVITDRNGVELYRLFNEEDRTVIPGDQIPQHMKDAIVAIEDERFFERGCLDIEAIARAVFRLGQRGGASTLTRQLARNALDLKGENIINRKMKELVLGCMLERKFTKQELLDLYLNWIPFGQNAYGIEQASSKYFGISAKDLTLAQSAVLASLPQRPTYFSPYGAHVRTTITPELEERIVDGDVTRASEVSDDDFTIGLVGKTFGTGGTTLYLGGRADQVLRNMQDQKFIAENDRLKALDDLGRITFQPSRENIRAAHFVLWVKEQVEGMLEGAEEGILEQGGLVIETTLDWEMQQAAEAAVTKEREDIQRLYKANNIALLALDPQTNEILAYVGNADYNDEEHEGKVDMVHAPRQPGSSFKPFVYAAAFLRGYSPGSVLYDVETKFGEDVPQNFDGSFSGLTTMRRALGASRNIPAVKTFFLAGGEEPILGLVASMGAPTPQQRRQELALERGEFEYGWPLALGAGETPLIEMTHAYSTLANGGVRKPIVSIRKITGKNGALLPLPAPEEEEEVLDPRIAYQVTSVLSDVSARPNEYWQNVLSVPGYAAAAKTGTSNKCLEREEEGECKDRKPDNLWTLGYTPSLVTGVWIGNANSSPLSEKAESLITAAPIWKDFMVRAHKLIEEPRTTFAMPAGTLQMQISTLSGQLPTNCTPIDYRKSDVFLEERAPSLPDPSCAELTVDKLTGLLASPGCPAEAQEKKSFLVIRDILPDRWPLWEQAAQEWAGKQMEKWNASPDHSGSLLPLPAAPTKECDPALTPGRLEKPEVKILFPLDNGIASFPSFQPKLEYTVGSKVREVAYSLDGKPVAKATEAPFDAPIRALRSVKKEGNHTLTVTLTDEYFNQVSDEISFRFEEDTQPPSVSFSLPRGDISLKKGGDLKIVADAHDAEGGIKHVQFFLSDKLLTTKPKEPFELTYTLTESPGSYVLKLIATDLAGNKGETTLNLTVE